MKWPKSVEKVENGGRLGLPAKTGRWIRQWAVLSRPPTQKTVATPLAAIAIIVRRLTWFYGLVQCLSTSSSFRNLFYLKYPSLWLPSVDDQVAGSIRCLIQPALRAESTAPGGIGGNGPSRSWCRRNGLQRSYQSCRESGLSAIRTAEIAGFWQLERQGAVQALTVSESQERRVFGFQSCVNDQRR